eukprot:TRINITY_DN56133_c0_g1_i1.p1 TRINITY_DN56133_c0_g1~~TRINITY_DN56133_c0_g1_i1.p1  ORF type:complete len:100 (-),score=24.51 TRINITY_DN56133_c0_g1_i1:141-440(-)
MIRRPPRSTLSSSSAASDVYKRQPLHCAAQSGDVDMARALLDAGAEIDKTNEAGVTPLYVAEVNGHDDVRTLLQSRGARLPCWLSWCCLLYTSPSPRDS